MEIKKIAVGIDFSEESEFAARHAIDIARKTGAEIVLVHAGVIVETPAHVPSSMSAAANEWETLLRQQLAGERARLEALRARMSGQGPQVSHVMVDGFPDTSLVEAAKEMGADLIVTGTHGRTGIKRFLLGSVSERVVRLSDINVMVARPPGVGPGGYRRILVPTDHSAPADQALALATALVADGGSVDAVNFWQVPVSTTSYYAPIRAADDLLTSLRTALAASAERAGAPLVEKHSGDGYELRFRAVEQTPAEGIQRLCEEERYDLVVMGSHGRRGVRRFLLGSVAEVTVRHAPCSVLVVHTPGAYDAP